MCRREEMRRGHCLEVISLCTFVSPRSLAMPFGKSLGGGRESGKRGPFVVTLRGTDAGTLLLGSGSLLGSSTRAWWVVGPPNGECIYS